MASPGEMVLSSTGIVYHAWYMIIEQWLFHFGSINDAYNNDPFRFNYPSIASCGRLQFRHHFFGFISCPLNHGQDFMCHVFHRYFSITFCWPLTFTSLYITFVCMKFLSSTLNFSSKEDLVDKVLEHVADGFSRTSFTVWAKHSEDREVSTFIHFEI